MLAEIVTTSIISLNLGARDHAALAMGNEGLYDQVMKRGKHICHVCGSRCHEGLEIDHISGHRKSAARDLRPICQFCHNLKHPLWAGARKKFVPVFAPDLTQVDLHRLAWVILAWRNVEGSPVNADKIIDMIELRRARFEEMTGCVSAEAFFEAVMTVADPEQLGRGRAIPLLASMDQYVRFWPSELTPEYEGLDPASRLSRWDVGGFRLISDEVATLIRNDLKPDPEKIRGLMDKIVET